MAEVKFKFAQEDGPGRRVDVEVPAAAAEPEAVFSSVESLLDGSSNQAEKIKVAGVKDGIEREGQETITEALDKILPVAKLKQQLKDCLRKNRSAGDKETTASLLEARIREELLKFAKEGDLEGKSRGEIKASIQAILAESEFVFELSGSNSYKPNKTENKRLQAMMESLMQGEEGEQVTEGVERPEDVRSAEVLGKINVTGSSEAVMSEAKIGKPESEAGPRKKETRQERFDLAVKTLEGAFEKIKVEIGKAQPLGVGNMRHVDYYIKMINPHLNWGKNELRTDKAKREELEKRAQEFKERIMELWNLKKAEFDTNDTLDYRVNTVLKNAVGAIRAEIEILVPGKSVLPKWESYRKRLSNPKLEGLSEKNRKTLSEKFLRAQSEMEKVWRSKKAEFDRYESEKKSGILKERFQKAADKFEVMSQDEFDNLEKEYGTRLKPAVGMDLKQEILDSMRHIHDDHIDSSSGQEKEKWEFILGLVEKANNPDNAKRYIIFDGKTYVVDEKAGETETVSEKEDEKKELEEIAGMPKVVANYYLEQSRSHWKRLSEDVKDLLDKYPTQKAKQEVLVVLIKGSLWETFKNNEDSLKSVGFSAEKAEELFEYVFTEIAASETVEKEK